MCQVLYHVSGTQINTGSCLPDLTLGPGFPLWESTPSFSTFPSSHLPQSLILPFLALPDFTSSRICSFGVLPLSPRWLVSDMTWVADCTYYLSVWPHCHHTSQGALLFLDVDSQVSEIVFHSSTSTN